MSLNGMAESRRLWCHWRVWLKCSKTVARQSQVLPVRACCLPSRELARQSRKPKHHRPYSLSRPRAGPSSLLSCRLPPTEGARDARGPIGPAGLNASRHRGLSTSCVLAARSGSSEKAKRAASPPNPGRPARGVLGLLRTVPGGRPFVTRSRRTQDVTLHR
jgi:hypothetical protein